MSTIRIGDVDIIYHEDSCLIGTVTYSERLFSEPCAWVSLSHPGCVGVDINRSDWEGFVKLVNEVDFFLKDL